MMRNFGRQAILLELCRAVRDFLLATDVINGELGTKVCLKQRRLAGLPPEECLVYFQEARSW